MAATFQRYKTDFVSSLNQKLEPPIKSHLKQVYSTLALATFSAGVGSYVHLYTNLMGGGFLSLLGTIGFGLALLVTPHNGKNTQKRLMYLMAFAACIGLAMGPLMEMAIYLNPRIIPMALVSTCLVFGSFSLSSIFSNHRSWLYMGGLLMSMLSVMTFMSLINIFVGSYLLFQVELYLGLIVFCLFIMFDTATIIEKRRMGDEDYIKHAMVLFIDVADLFRTILILLMQKERSNDSRRRSRSRN